MVLVIPEVSWAQVLFLAVDKASSRVAPEAVLQALIP